MKQKIKNVIRYSKYLNIFPRIFFATKYYNWRYLQILKWGFNSKEDTNYTFGLTEGNLKTMGQIISVVTQQPYNKVYGYILEVLNDNELKNYIINKVNESKYKGVADSRFDLHKRLDGMFLIGY